ncbi:type II secretion system F family protein [Trueperella bialowiezensis]|uniref:Flp pilus assembly protein TadB n=1 Tax=Trueperella bialowiezensis TaxID=312285 RepID=A0A3S4WHB4_9ACTO|nr:type II secretion system F family protein [Trueperella bialowiezensis]VEI13955.1 Flp pilus assembly protein TadB [Trueperella bialowiezensis]
MAFLTGAVIGLGIFLIVVAYRNPREVRLPNGRRVGQFLMAAAGGAALAATISQSIPITVAIGLLCGLIPGVWRGARERRRREELRNVWPEVIDDIVANVRAGLPIGESLALLAVRGPELTRPAFTQFAHHLRADGRLDPALDELKTTLADPMTDRILEALRLAHGLGGRDIANTLTSLAAMVREENRARGELLARQSWTVNGARLAAVAPWIMLLLFSTRPGAIDAFATRAGTAVLIVGFVATVVAYWLMLRLGRLPEETRIFAGGSHG